jgi:hypothetical protein
LLTDGGSVPSFIRRDGIDDLDIKKSMPFEKLSVAFAD